MTKKIYIGNLPFETTEDRVRQLLAPYGAIESVAMIRDRDSGRFRGFCFVEMDEGAANKAIAGLKGKKVDGRKIKVNEARRSKNKRQSNGNKNNNRRSDDSIPLHERTARGGYGAHDEGGYPHSGGMRGRQEWKREKNRDGNNKFPHSGGSRFNR